MKYELQSGAHSTYLLAYHLVRCVKYRRSVLTHRVGDRLKEMVSEILKETVGGAPLEIIKRYVESQRVK